MVIKEVFSLRVRPIIQRVSMGKYANIYAIYEVIGTKLATSRTVHNAS